MRELCADERLGWDDPVDDQYTLQWNQWMDQLPMLKDVHISRCIKPTSFDCITSSTIHVFSDASSVGYGAVAYLRLVDVNNEKHCSFLLGKARLAPLKICTIPRLELTAATVAVRLGCVLKQELDLPIDHTVYHTDSTTVLHYLLSAKKRFPIFIANRVRFILDHSEGRDWRYVETGSNPADHASRGMNVSDIIAKESWLNGPEFLWEDESSWPPQPQLANEYEISEDSLCTSTATTVDSTVISPTEQLINHYSEWQRLKYAVATFRKLIQILKDRTTDHQHSNKYAINVMDLHGAEQSILCYTQRKHFQSEIDALTSSNVVPKTSSLYNLDPKLNHDLLCVGGRLGKSSLPDAEKFPILLPKKEHVTSLIISEAHTKFGHAGRNHTLAKVRESYWVIHGNSTVRGFISKCVPCRKMKGPFCLQKMADLPP